MAFKTPQEAHASGGSWGSAVSEPSGTVLKRKRYSDPLSAGPRGRFEVHQSVNLYFTSAHRAGKPSLQEIFFPSL
jgi:hypothetical protein